MSKSGSNSTGSTSTPTETLQLAGRWQELFLPRLYILKLLRQRRPKFPSNERIRRIMGGTKKKKRKETPLDNEVIF